MRISSASKRKSTLGKVGRPPAGDGGTRVKDYPQVSFRLPAEIRDKLAALSEVRKQPQWRLVVDSVECYMRDLPRLEQTQIARLVSRRRSKSLQ
jgi:predicted DNA-binding protein